MSANDTSWPRCKLQSMCFRRRSQNGLVPTCWTIQDWARVALAKTIAAELATDFHEVLGQSIASPSDLNAVLLQAKDNSIVHIDEAHQLRKEYQTAIYLAIDQRKLILNGGKQIESSADRRLHAVAFKYSMNTACFSRCVIGCGWFCDSNSTPTMN